MKFLIIILFYLSTFKTLYSLENLYSPYSIDLENLTASKPTNLETGNPIKGKKIFISRRVNCLSCHAAPIPEERFHGNVGPSLLGIGNRYNKDEIRIRIIDSKLLNPMTIMPSYHKNLRYPRIDKSFFNKKILKAEEVEHLVEYLYSLKDENSIK
tara:strand:- start:69 stop:533 length:465 start_codon:yes stop_codon:yes gene_type:complete